jgi:glycosyltransferase involved in cell wall biosynthesis
MRILLFCQLFPPLTYGGGETLFWNLAKSLVLRGHEVHVITQRVKGEKDSETKCGVNILRVGRPADYSGALTTNLVESLAYMTGALVAGIRVASRRQVDVIHSNTYVPALVGQICASILRKAHVITVHDVYLAAMPWFWREWSQQRSVGYLARFIGPLLERLLLRMPATAIHTVSETSKQDILQIGANSKIFVVPNGINVIDYLLENEISANPHQAIFVGRLVFYKNLEIVFRALTRVIQTVRDAKLVIVGDGPMRTTWSSMADDLGLNQHVQFLGRIPHVEKLRQLRQSAFLLLPSRVEGFGIVILEAFACNKPVLVSSIGALRELVSDEVDGFLADPNVEEDWAKKMMMFFTDFKRSQQMGLIGRTKCVSNFSNERVAKDMEKLYELTLSEKRTGAWFRSAGNESEKNP